MFPENSVYGGKPQPQIQVQSLNSLSKESTLFRKMEKYSQTQPSKAWFLLTAHWAEGRLPDKQW